MVKSARYAYYNDIDPHTCAWTEELIKAKLIPDGVVDCRSITEVQPEDIKGFKQCHFFNGIAGWALALQLANWPVDLPVWCASLPCQPFSIAGRRKGIKDERHLWPEFYRLVKDCKPGVIFGEQVEAAIRMGWLDEVFDDLEKIMYSTYAVVLPVSSVGAPHMRHRIYWAATTKEIPIEAMQEVQRNLFKGKIP